MATPEGAWWRPGLQTTVVMAHVFLAAVAPVVCSYFILRLLYTQYWWVSIAYLTWMTYDAKVARVQRRGGRRWEWLRNAAHMTLYRDYFPISLHKTASISPDKNYIFGCHPHGALSASYLCNFGSNATGFTSKFPGLKSHLLALEWCLSWPLARDYPLLMGLCDVSQETINWLLTRQGKGNACVIIVGGAAEALDARPGKVYNLTLLHRKGFVKSALETGSSLVPVFSFGENELFKQVDNPRGSLLRTFQEALKSILGFAPPLFYGRGLFNCSFGFTPYRKPINTVVGASIDVPHTPDPSKDVIGHYHKLYMNALRDLFDTHKAKYEIHNDMILNFL